MAVVAVISLAVAAAIWMVFVKIVIEMSGATAVVLFNLSSLVLGAAGIMLMAKRGAVWALAIPFVILACGAAFVVAAFAGS